MGSEICQPKYFSQAKFSLGILRLELLAARCFGEPKVFFTGLAEGGGVLLFSLPNGEKQLDFHTSRRTRPERPTKAWQTGFSYQVRRPLTQSKLGRRQSCSRSKKISGGVDSTMYIDLAIAWKLCDLAVRLSSGWRAVLCPERVTRRVDAGAWRRLAEKDTESCDQPVGLCATPTP